MLTVLLLLVLFSFRKLGDGWSVEIQVTDEREAFTCLMCGHARKKSVNTVRSIMLRKMIGENEELTTKSTVDLSRRPPCRDSLVPRIARVNYRLANYKRAHKAIVLRSNPYDLAPGWENTEEGVLEPVWSCSPVLPPSLIDLLEEVEEEEEGQEVDYEELLSDDE